MKMESKKDYEELKPVDDTGSVGGGGSYGNPQPQKPNNQINGKITQTKVVTITKLKKWLTSKKYKTQHTNDNANYYDKNY